MEEQTQSRLDKAKSELFTAFDEELRRQVGDARSEAATALVAEIELLRLQLHDLQEQAGAGQQALAAAEQQLTAAKAEAEAAHEQARQAKDEADEQHVRAEQAEAELQRVGEAGALVSSELLSASESADSLQAENERLSGELEHERGHRQAAEEQLLDAAVSQLLERDSLAVAAQAREEALFARLVDVQAQARAALELAQR